MDQRKNPHVVCASGRVDIRAADGSPLDDATLSAIHGAASDSGLCSSSHEVFEMGLLGGRVQLSYDPTVGCFEACAKHESPMPLGDKELDLLKDRTRGDWNDGEAACFFDYLGGNLGFALRVSWRDPLLVYQYPWQECRFHPWSELASACWRGNLEAARAALDAGEDVNERPEGLPILHGAIVRGHFEVAQLLIVRGADVHARDLLEFRRDPLRTCATSNGMSDVTVRIARMLLERGADPLFGGDASPLTVAKRRKWDRLVQLFEECTNSACGGLEATGSGFGVGDWVRIRVGAFAGMMGRVEQGVCTDAVSSAKIRIEVFGRGVMIDVPFNELQLLGLDKPKSSESGSGAEPGRCP